ncbi:MarR family winged helix-turn-helix transcriptional regulator [Actinoplanes sp. NBRC 101535]|uniref:MarR family winged helix-turn-helix transcriptional regulator n=1 Tax=Actinoplanes sp. NBRC 101535 TaxID=3032196 RepID=UPI0024A20EC6|nr:MarR family winged helix-turn-helix transcriptional regulator [Actinoplanes sp. NBRC 101535]GLY03050.1 putative transcriptional regulator, MarR family protein [Actinoplanes sp. NBRC 101535]
MEAEQISRVRDFNRYYTQRFGALTDRFLGQVLPLSQARLLVEIGDGADVRDLRARLGLDSGYLSRLLRSLQVQGLVRLRAHDGDGRVRVAELTDAGRLARADLDDRSQAGIAALLGELTGRQREQLIHAQEQIRRVLRAAAITVEPVAPQSPAARDCLARYAAELMQRLPEGYDAAALTPPHEVTGTQLVAFEDGEPAGCGLWIRLGPGIAEIRHLWVSGSARGLGLGRRLLGRLECDAATHGVTTVRLGTHRALREALALYHDSGYEVIGAYSDSPYNQVGFEKRLDGQSPPPPGRLPGGG